MLDEWYVRTSNRAYVARAGVLKIIELWSSIEIKHQHTQWFHCNSNNI